MAKKSEETGGKKRKAAALQAEPAPETAPKPKTSRSKGKLSIEIVPELPEKAKSAPAKTKTTVAKPRKLKVTIKDETGEPLEVPVPAMGPLDDPIGDTTDGEARFSLSTPPDAEMAAYRADAADDALEGTLENRPAGEAVAAPPKPAGGNAGEDAGARAESRVVSPSVDAVTPTAESDPGSDLPSAAEAELPKASHGRGEFSQASAAPAKLDRLQKILSRSGVASRRHAEEMIEAGRVMVNGQVVTQLGAKADAERDHIRVDGKLITGAERHRYFVLNKPKGFVTTVSDPEGRPTVMQFFAKMSERLYPVGRLDYDSEGLLLVTNDGELANQLTKASSGVEKTYLVKVAGQPTEDELDQLRSGVPIEHGAPGSHTVHTAPAAIRQVRQGDNPWYEVVLIEGRNRELRKMFQSIGHFVEKIRRVGYGPLVLDLEPGKLRELAPEEVSILRLAAEGKWKPKSAQAGPRPRGGKPSGSRAAGTGRPSSREAGYRTERGGARPMAQRPPRDSERPPTGDFRDRRSNQGSREGARPQQRSFPGASRRPNQGPPRGERPPREGSSWKPRDERSSANRSEQRPFRGRPSSDSAGRSRGEERPFRPQPHPGSAPRGNWEPRGDRPPFPRRDQPDDRNRGQNQGPARGRFDKPAARRFAGDRGGFEGRPSRPFPQPHSDGRTGRPEKSWSRDEGRRPGRSEGSSPAPRGEFRRPSGPRPTPERRDRPAFGSGDRSSAQGNRSTTPRNGGAPGSRGFTPGRSPKPGGSRFGFKGGAGGGRRGGPSSGGKRPGGRNRG